MFTIKTFIYFIKVNFLLAVIFFLLHVLPIFISTKTPSDSNRDSVNKTPSDAKQDSVGKIPSDDNLDSVKIIYYYGPTYDDHIEYDLENVVSILQHPKFIHKKTSCFMPAFRNRKNTPDTLLMVESYLKRNDTNFLKLHWEELASGSYNSAQRNVLKLSPKVADSIIELFKAGLDEDSFSLTGSSMGARGIAVIGRDVFERSQGKMLISRITPLDPSNEAAHKLFILPPIEKSHAKFVDIIHTDAGGIGTTKSMGHANFWINNGIATQPGCEHKHPYTVCNHRKSLAYWAESVANGNTKSMLAYRSGSYDNLLKNGAENYRDTAVVMGMDCPSSARGDYYMQLNSTFGDYYLSFLL